MRLIQIIAATAMALAACSFAHAAGPIAPQVDLPSTKMAPILVHGTCHSDFRRHNGSLHRHRQSDCKVIIADSFGDCHHSVLRHFLPGYGKVWHRHRGPSCQIEIYEHESGPSPGIGGCVQIGPSVICGYGKP